MAALLLGGALAAPSAALAQTAVGTLGASTSDRYRGLGPSYPGAVVRAGAVVDTEVGAYANVLAQYQLKDRHWGRSQLLFGWSRPIDADWGWDVGGARTLFGADRDYDYTEWMAGIVHRDGSVRAWWAHHYYGQRPGSLYLEANASWPFANEWRLVGHLGRLGYLGNGPYGPWAARVDGLLGLAWSHDAFDVRFTVDGLLAGREPYGHIYGSAGQAATLSFTWAY